MCETTRTTSILMPLPRLAGVGNFCLNLLSPFSRSCASSLFSSHIVPDLSLCILTISWVNPFSFSQFFQAPKAHIFGSWCLNVLMTILHRRLWNNISSIFTTTPTIFRRTSLNTLSTSFTRHIKVFQIEVRG